MKTMLKIILTGIAVLLPITSYAAEITGAGSTFGAPIYTKWGEATKNSIGINVNYQAIGSGAGQTQIINRTVDFGASDAPISDQKLLDHNLMQIPTVMGAVVVVVNVPGIASNTLRLSPNVLTDIYLGKIKTWDDAKIAADNPGITLPKLAISPVYRADGSGTTFVFTNYLSNISTDWQTNVGTNTSVKWPVGNGGRGNDGVAAVVVQIKGAIGYVESVYASKNNMVTALLKNADGKWIKPSTDSYNSAARNADWTTAKNFRVNLINQRGENSWPIMSATYLLIPTDAKNTKQTKLVTDWITWAYQNGNNLAQELDYIPLPVNVQEQAIKQLHTINK